MKRPLMLFATVLVVACLFLTQRASAAQFTPSSQTISFNTVWQVTQNGVSDYCVVSGPAGTIEYANPLVTIAQRQGSTITQCQQALKEFSASLRKQYPLVGFNFVIEGRSLGTV